MPDSSIDFKPRSARGMVVTLRTPRGWQLQAEGDVDTLVPEFTGAEKLSTNKVVTVNLWAYACAEKGRRLTRDPDLKTELARGAKNHGDLTCHVADLVDKVGMEAKEGWCSSCFGLHEHRRVESGFSIPTYLCTNCGAATLTCAALRCENMAIRDFGALRIPRYCAEHRHDIPSFTRGSDRIDQLSNFAELLRFDKKNLAKTTKVAGGVLALAGVMTGVGVAAAPLVGGFVGSTFGGYTGVVATNYGLAALGGGSLASGGFGMAGGTVVVAAAGAGLGGAMGAGLTSAYVGEDRSFRIEKLKDGPGIPVVVCSGFLTEKVKGWGDWERIVTERYPDSPVFRVHWGAEELQDLYAVISGNAGKAALAKFAGKAVLKASKQAAKKAGPIGGALVVVDLVKNPWWRARERANKTGAIVAELIARTSVDEVVLVGHSLGARVMLYAADALSLKSDAPRVRDVHLLGAAVSSKHDWSRLHSVVTNAAYVYHSRNDAVLSFVYTIVQGGSKAAGSVGAATKLRRIHNVDVTTHVAGHSAYCTSVDLRGAG